jgi:hypothetical protein
MPRVLPPDALAAMMAPETDQAFITLLRIGLESSPDLLFTDYSEDITSNLEIYSALPFSFIAPANNEGELAEAKLTLDNVDRQLIDDIRAQTVPLKITVTVVSSSALDDPVAVFKDMVLRNVNYDALSITGSLVLENLYAENFSQLMTGRDYPALFFAQ